MKALSPGSSLNLRKKEKKEQPHRKKEEENGLLQPRLALPES